MKRFSILAVALAVFAAGCSSNNSSPSDSNTSTVKFTAQLLASNEPGTIQGGEGGANGTSIMTFHVAKNAAGAITTATVDFVVTMAGFPAATLVNIAHIHTGATGVNGPILINTTLAPTEVTLVNGAGSFTRANEPMGAADAQAIINNPAGFYFNVHTQANAGGVMRGQLVSTP